ncbi:MAG: glycerophosphoryl diester phosphodiesterase [Frankiales bacterium]|nr:glycerophosphoryl diester phosphodiesterase [Frankiales bacterium]
MSHPLARARARARIRARALPENKNPLIFAHRGASSDIAEHTLPAYLKAIESGADGLECDVRLTRDGHLVCVHDRTVDRTSNGRGVVSDLDLSGLQQLDFQSWKGEPAEQADTAYLRGVEADRIEADGGGRVLTLDALLAVVIDSPRPLRLLIETKHPTRYGGLVEKELVRSLRRVGMNGAAQPGKSSVTVMSFAPVALRRVRLLSASLPLVLLMERPSPIRRDGSLPLGVDIAGAGLRLLRSDPGYVARAHAAGHAVYCWTVDERRDVDFVRRLGIDAIITNRPATVRQQLADG